ncbi:phosphoglucomutase/phosphomannomutase family protein [Oceanithermus desulfurans]|uniref:Phosphohexose mutase n=2 Tax=Oceanithermus desulfurans TaxID=227924 RepID=A0A511RNE1_9DEIN|nr:phosphoglucomutase/phosphomannomutase family protein [Oceanithermus desulfurans]MBB6029061.1 phosphomannomutase [Oceanithermus desulfurans]GEM90452.1 phosphohexose mutase [Oceanithermus desulfurans NBRC 100063]
MDELRFGTDGWRDVIADRYTFANVARVAQATADYVASTGGGRVVVGYDTRFLSDRFAAHVAGVIAANGLEAQLAKGYLPTPVTSFAVVRQEAAAGVMITASHNPPEYNGYKLKGPYGGSATPEIYDGMIRRLDATPAKAPDPGAVRTFDLREVYYDRIGEIVDLESLRAYSGALYHDAMGGAGGGWLAGFVKHAGLALDLRELHGVPHPLFYGVHPEPIPQNLVTLRAVMSAEKDPVFAAVTDGDADRIGAVLAGGVYFNSHQIFAVLLRHLHRKGLRGRVVKTFSVSQVVDRLAEKLGLEVVTTPVGFKYITDEFLKGDVLIGGEESGGIGVAGHIPERDGLLNALLLLESVVTSGRSLGEQFAEIEELVGLKHAFDRLDLKVASPEARDEVMKRLHEAPPERVGRFVVERVETLDGVKLHLAGGAWLLFRPSGTEPLLRIYCEAEDTGTVKHVLKEARKLVGV